MSKSWYRAAPGVAWVNGAAVPEQGRVFLTDEEAAFDLGLGRIAKEQPIVPPTNEANAKRVSPSRRRRRADAS